jgi:hypothetical protein
MNIWIYVEPKVAKFEDTCILSLLSYISFKELE